jgi:hypothetical protein
MESMSLSMGDDGGVPCRRHKVEVPFLGTERELAGRNYLALAMPT